MSSADQDREPSAGAASNPGQPPGRDLSRRRFLAYLALSGASAEVLAACSDNGADQSANTAAPSETTTPPGTTARPAPAPTTAPPATAPLDPIMGDAVANRILVVVDLRGGNDGLSTLTPVGDNAYRQLRPTIAAGHRDVLEIEKGIGLHRNLARLQARGLATVEGVGPVDGELSHFSMEARWQQGDVDGRSAQTTGFLGRVVDLLRTESPITGLSLAGPTPHLLDTSNASLALGSHREIQFLAKPDWEAPELFRSQIRSLKPAGVPLLDTAAENYQRLLALAERLTDVPANELPEDDPMLAEGGELGEQLDMAADAIIAELGVRVIYARYGDFDTHANHLVTHDQMMRELDASIDGFFRRLDEHPGIAERVVLATISEFGRRARETSGGGLDHGVASTSLVIAGTGSGAPTGRFGDPPPLHALDDRANLPTTVGFDRYLAALAQDWLGVRASAVLPHDPEPLQLFR